MLSQNSRRLNSFISQVLFVLLIGLSFAGHAQSEKVYVTRTGQKYHAMGCQYLRNSSIEIQIDSARERGYAACSVCKPGKNGLAVKPSSEKPGLTGSVTTAQETEDVEERQCSSLTKAGARCKRSTSDASGKCWQHQ